MTHTRTITIACASLAVGLGVYGAANGAGPSGSTAIPQPTGEELKAAGIDVHVAPESARVDLRLPRFSHPTKITNPLFPISDLPSAILSGRVDGKDFKTETTLLPETRIIEWEGRKIRTLVSQYLAYLGWRIEEVALDHYAQADDGSVWYLGEDVFNYKDGAIADTEGTWFAGREGPPALIMPGNPKVGDVFRPENVPGFVFEEVRIKSVGRAVDGPHGPVQGAIVAGELHQDGSRENKHFAPGYGEFLTASGGDVEAMSLAVPADRLPGPVPAQLETISAAAADALDAARTKGWSKATASASRARAAWTAFRGGDVPPRIEIRMTRALDRLAGAVAGRNPTRAGLAAIGVAQSSLDLQLRHREPAAIDRDRFELWAHQLGIDGDARDAGGVRGDLATLEWIRDRFTHKLPKVEAVRVDARLGELRSKLNDDDLRGAAATARRLADELPQLAG